MTVMKNLTFLASDMDGAQNELLQVESDLHKAANDHFSENDRYMDMNPSQKENMFDEQMAEFTTSLNMVKKKFGIIYKKVEELGAITDDFHYSTDKLEALYKRDIEKRRVYFQEHPLAIGTIEVEGAEVSLRDIDEVFD